MISTLQKSVRCEKLAQGGKSEIPLAFLEVSFISFVLDWRADVTELDNRSSLGRRLDNVQRPFCYSVQSGRQVTADL